MYLPSAFVETRAERLAELMNEYPFATLVVPASSAPEVTHVPVLFDAAPGPFGHLRGHVALPNPIWRAFDGATECIAIFRGPDGYVSPSWYPSRVEVPTWNYAVVHAHGPILPRRDAAFIDHILESLVAQYERGARAWSLQELPSGFYAELRSEIVGFEMHITRLEGKFKLSQNKNAATRRAVVEALGARGSSHDSALARLVTRALESSSDEG
jgi:transcriptional regulator